MAVRILPQPPTPRNTESVQSRSFVTTSVVGVKSLGRGEIDYAKSVASQEAGAQAYSEGTSSHQNGDSSERGCVTYPAERANRHNRGGEENGAAQNSLPRSTARHAQDSIARAACDAAGVPYKGILDCGIGSALVLFDCPIHRTTMAVKLWDVTPEIVAAHLAECSFGHAR